MSALQSVVSDVVVIVQDMKMQFKELEAVSTVLFYVLSVLLI